jgi:hypothetical protein
MASKKIKKKISVFANIIISVSISVGLFMTLITLIEYWVLRIPIPSDVLAVLIGFWGGELLIVALRQVFGSDIMNKKKNNESEDLP